MSDAPQTQPPGWYYAQGDPPGTQRYWNGTGWLGGPQPVPGAAIPGYGVTDLTLADPIKRIGSRFIDLLVWLAITIVISIRFGVSAAVGDSGFVSNLIGTLLACALITVYEVVMISTRGATLGKLALGTRVVRSDGSPVDATVGIRRMLTYIVYSLLSLIPLLGFIALFALLVATIVMLFADDRHQTPWDKLAGTIVVER